MKKLGIPFLIWGLLILGCSGATNVNSSCSSSGNSGRCTLKFGKVEGNPYEYKMEASLPPNAKSAEVTAQISSGKNALNVWFEDPDRNKIKVKVEPGQRTTLEGLARLQTDMAKQSISFYFEPLGEGDKKTAEDVEVEVRYKMP
jgi:hypothetical protein